MQTEFLESSDDEGEDQLYFLRGKNAGLDDSDKKNISDILTTKRFVILAGVFFFLFFASVFLWILLFGMLNSKNMELGGYVIDVPTLGDYYEVYTNFYSSYDENLQKMKDMNKRLDIGSNSEYKVSVLSRASV